ncbi:DUF222 domain-containing protein [Knoellia sp. 3-2P3]|uniref:HNH endonuclease n=1 Tax=unclassified Knoellia TaxID=2618719 RepID=UPI0023DAF181|nr:HNH endonuclease signature motif containing protein [Knoellia sp. 3-2P3]MDF2093770.1 DUF222 domain-containing protein [Knoellia sp. 3-2P3]
MFEPVSGEGSLTTAPLPKAPSLTTADLAAFLERLPTLDTAVSDAERVDQLGLLEAVKHACAGAQATVAVAFDASQREVQAAAGVPARERGRGVAAQVALARRESPARGSRHLGLARALAAELPHTGEHLRHGRVSEWRATIVARETACLSAGDRTAVDAALAPELPTLSDRQVESRAKALAVRFDAAAVVQRAAKARADRRVSLRPAPDTMTYLTALLPVEQGVAAYAALHAAVGAARATGDGAAPDPRGAGQVMADTLVERLTGQATAAAVPLEVQLVLPAETLLGGDEPATLPGEHPVPAAFARRLLTDTADCADSCSDAGAALTLRRLFTTPTGDQLVAMDSRRRVFDGQLRRFLTLRDQSCRTPWCDAPIRHADHVVPDRAGGPTSAPNGQGLCAACNHAKEAPGWSAVATAPGPTAADPHAPPHRVRTTTPTGHTYDSTAPPLLPARGDPRRAHLWRDNVITITWAERHRLPDLLDSA